MCRLYSVSRAGFYAWVNRPMSAQAQANRVLGRQIQAVFAKSAGTYGSPRIHAQLQQEGVQTSRTRVARVMKKEGLKARLCGLYRRAPGLDTFFHSIGNRLKDMEVTGIDQAWVADLTYIRVKHRWVYLATVMDIHSRRILGWSLGKRKSTVLTERALRKAIQVRRPPVGLVFHTDRGVEYISSRFVRLLSRYGCIPSRNRPGRCTDNAFMESFFHSLKAELIHGAVFRAMATLRRSLENYIDCFYNPVRLHSALGYSSPMAFEQMNA